MKFDYSFFRFRARKTENQEITPQTANKHINKMEFATHPLILRLIVLPVQPGEDKSILQLRPKQLLALERFEEIAEAFDAHEFSTWWSDWKRYSNNKYFPVGLSLSISFPARQSFDLDGSAAAVVVIVVLLTTASVKLLLLGRGNCFYFLWEIVGSFLFSMLMAIVMATAVVGSS